MMIDFLLQKVRRSDFLKNTAVLTSGTTLAQAVSILTAPFLTRIYHPSDYGMLGIFMVFTSLVVTISTLQYHNAIVIAKEEEEAKKVLQLALIINAAVSGILALFLLLFGRLVGQMYQDPQILKWLPLAPLSVFFVGLNNIFTAWAVRRAKFKLVAFNRISAAFLVPVFSITLGLLVSGPTGLFTGLIVSQVIPTIRMTYYFFNAEKLKLSFLKADMGQMLKRFRNFPLFSMPSDFLNNFTNQLPIMMLSRIGGAQVVGWYGLSVRILGLPSSLVATAVGDVFRQRASKDYHETGSCKPVFLKVFKSLLLLAVPPFVILFILGPQLFAWVFGEKWREAGHISQLLGLLYMFRFIVSPLTYVTYIVQKQWIGLLSDIVLFLTLASIYYITLRQHLPYTTALFIYAASYAALYFLTFYISLKLTENAKPHTEN
ncbi:MAG: oligosaccharide flippase family protein [Bacteroidetes bacterium]|nr:oligosaccharide flippase family protein [Bacteroidota bacterium]